MRPARSAVSIHERTRVGLAKITEDTVNSKMDIPEPIADERPGESLFQDDAWSSVIAKAKQTLFDVPPPELADLESDVESEARRVEAEQVEDDFPVEDTVAHERIEEEPIEPIAPIYVGEARPFVQPEPPAIFALQNLPALVEEPAPLAPVAYEPASVEVAFEAAPLEAEAAAAEPIADRKGEILVMFGCRGGAGATTLTVNLAGVLAKKGRRVAVVDLDLQLGDVFVTLDLEPDTSIAGLSRDVATLDDHGLVKRMRKHPTGFFALSQTGRLDDVDSELADRLPNLLERLKRTFDIVIIDGVRDFDDYALAALDAADHIALVVTQDVPAVRRAARVVSLCRKLKYSERKLRVIVNRAHKKAQVPVDAVEKALSLPVRAQVANDWGSSVAALNAGVLLDELSKRSRLTADVAALADVLTTQPAAVAPVEKPGFWARLFGRARRNQPSCA